MIHVSDGLFEFRKYRAWHKELGKMLYPPHPFDSMTYCRDSEGNHVNYKEVEDISENEAEEITYNFHAHVTWDGRWYENGKYQDVIWLQFIGLETHDEKKEIFEGDVLKYNGDVSKHKGKNGVVRYEPDYGGFILEFEYSQHQHHLLLTCDVAFESTHMGNKYENPGLLK